MVRRDFWYFVPYPGLKTEERPVYVSSQPEAPIFFRERDDHRDPNLIVSSSSVFSVARPSSYPYHVDHWTAAQLSSAAFHGAVAAFSTSAIASSTVASQI